MGCCVLRVGRNSGHRPESGASLGGGRVKLWTGGGDRWFKLGRRRRPMWVSMCIQRYTLPSKFSIMHEINGNVLLSIIMMLGRDFMILGNLYGFYSDLSNAMVTVHLFEHACFKLRYLKLPASNRCDFCPKW